MHTNNSPPLQRPQAMTSRSPRTLYDPSTSQKPEPDWAKDCFKPLEKCLNQIMAILAPLPGQNNGICHATLNPRNTQPTTKGLFENNISHLKEFIQTFSTPQNSTTQGSIFFENDISCLIEYNYSVNIKKKASFKEALELQFNKIIEQISSSDCQKRASDILNNIYKHFIELTFQEESQVPLSDLIVVLVQTYIDFFQLYIDLHQQALSTREDDFSNIEAPQERTSDKASEQARADLDILNYIKIVHYTTLIDLIISEQENKSVYHSLINGSLKGYEKYFSLHR